MDNLVCALESLSVHSEAEGLQALAVAAEAQDALTRKKYSHLPETLLEGEIAEAYKTRKVAKFTVVDQFATPYTLLEPKGSTLTVMNGETGQILAIVLKGALAEDAVCVGRRCLAQAASPAKGRMMLSTDKKKKMPNTGIIGFFDYLRAPITPKGTETAYTRRHREALFPAVDALLGSVDALYRQCAPGHYQRQREAVGKWSLRGSVFSTVTVNSNFCTAAHTDSGDFTEGLGCMAILSGKWHGCHFMLPEFSLEFDLEPCDLILFDTRQIHGNTAFEGDVHLQQGNERVTCVFYYRTALASLPPPGHHDHPYPETCSSTPSSVQRSLAWGPVASP